MTKREKARELGFEDWDDRHTCACDEIQKAIRALIQREEGK